MKRLFFLLALCACLPLYAQQPSGTPKTISEFLKMSPSDTTVCLVNGVVTRLRSNSSSGNLYISDGTGELFIYGIVDPARPGLSFRHMDIKQGDTVSFSGTRQVYKGTVEMVSARLMSKANGPDHDAPIKYDRELSFKGKSGADAMDAFTQWVNSKVKYPEGAQGAEGTVVVRFVIGRNGGVQEVQVDKGVSQALNDEAVRVVRSSPKWKPAVLDGNPVRLTRKVSVSFTRP